MRKKSYCSPFAVVSKLPFSTTCRFVNQLLSSDTGPTASRGAPMCAATVSSFQGVTCNDDTDLSNCERICRIVSLTACESSAILIKMLLHPFRHLPMHCMNDLGSGDEFVMATKIEQRIMASLMTVLLLFSFVSPNAHARTVEDEQGSPRAFSGDETAIFTEAETTVTEAEETAPEAFETEAVENIGEQTESTESDAYTGDPSKAEAVGTKAPIPSEGRGVSGEGKYGNLDYEWGIDWGTVADGTNYSYDDNGVLMIHPTSWANCQASVSLRFYVDHANTVEYIPAGAVQFRIPSSIFHSWDRTPLGTMTSDIKTEPGSDYDFIIEDYSSERGYYQISNYKAINGGSKEFLGHITWTVNPLDLNGGYPDDANPGDPWWTSWLEPYQDEFKVSLSLEDSSICEHSFHMDVRTRVKTVTAMSPLPGTTANTAGNACWLSWQDLWGPKPDDAEDYFYIVWRVGTGRSGTLTTQPFESTVQMLEEDNQIILTDAGGNTFTYSGQVVGIKKSPSKAATAANPNFDPLSTFGATSNLGTLMQPVHRLVYTRFGAYTPHSTGYASDSTVTSPSANNAGIYRSVYWNVLMRYPWSALEKAIEINGDDALETTGLPVTGKLRLKETWDSGYEWEIVKTADTRVFLRNDFGDGTSKPNLQKYVDTNSQSFRSHPLGQMRLLAGYPVPLRGGNASGWVIDFGDQARVDDTGASRGQHVELHDTGLFLTPGNYGPDNRKWADVDANKEVLNDTDYALTGFYLDTWNEFNGSVSHGYLQIDTSRSRNPDDYNPIYFFIRKQGESAFQPYCAVTMGSDGITHSVQPWDGTAINLDETVSKKGAYWQFPEGTVEFKAAYDSESYRCRLILRIQADLLPTEHVKQIVRTHQENSGNASYTSVFNGLNLTTVPLVEPEAETETKTATHRNTSVEKNYHILTRPSIATSLRKYNFVPSLENEQQNQASQQGKRLAWVVLRSSVSTTINRASEQETRLYNQYQLRKGSFYELLPRGTRIRPDSLRLIYTESSSSTYSPTPEKYAANNSMFSPGSGGGSYRTWGPEALTVESYEDAATGQTMVKISFDIPEISFSSPYQTSEFYSSVSVAFQLENSFENISANGEMTVNNLGLVLDGFGTGQYTAAGNTFEAVSPNMNDGQRTAFADIYNNVDERNQLALFTQNNIVWPRSGVVEAGFNKLVAAEESEFGLPGTDFSTEAEVTVGGKYRYRLRYIAQTNAATKDIVFYDILETGTQDVDMTSDWKGSFNSVDLQSVQEIRNAAEGSAAYCDPVVYYSTTLTAKNDRNGDYFDLTDASLWTTQMPDDPAEITAIAVDCSTDTEGAPFVLGADQSMYVILDMDAPATYHSGQAFNGAVVRASVGVDMVYDATAMLGSALVTLRDFDIHISKESNPPTGTQTEPCVVKGDGSGTIDYTLRVSNNGPVDLENVVVEDTIPQGLTIKKILVGTNGKDPVPVADAPDVTVERNGQRLTFTIEKQHPGADANTVLIIQTDVDELETADVKRYENTAYITAVNNVELDEPLSTETMYHRAGRVEAAVSKSWSGDEAYAAQVRPSAVTVQLLADGEPLGTAQELSESNSWNHSFGLLEKYRTNDDGILIGEEIQYTVQEVDLGAPGYISRVDRDTDRPGFIYIVTNTFTPATVSLQATKELVGRDWTVDDQFTFVLLNSADEELDRKAATAAEHVVSFNAITYSQPGNYSYVIRELGGTGGGISYDTADHNVLVTVGKDADGQLLVESVVYDDQRQLTITNRYDSAGEVVLRAQKLLNNQKLAADMFSFQLKDAEGNVLQTVGNQADGSIVFDPLHYDRSLFKQADGSYAEEVELIYTIEEVNEGKSGYSYDSKVVTVTVTLSDNGEGEINAAVKYASEGSFLNVYNPTLDIRVSKIWQDAENRDGIRPAQISVNLLADGIVVHTAVLNQENAWGHVFKDLFRYDAAGKEIVYTIAEVAVPAGYSALYGGNADEGFVVTNTHQPETLVITVKKVWDDQNNVDRIRPEKITVNLVADETVVMTVELTSANQWTHSFVDLPKYSNGKTINYSVEEIPVAGYTASIRQDSANEIVITNTHKPKTSSTSPETGDQSDSIWRFLMVLSLLGVVAAAAALFRTRRRQE